MTMNNEYHEMARPIEPKGMSINKKLIKSWLTPILIGFVYYVSIMGGANYSLAEDMLDQGKSAKQIESTFNNLKEDKRSKAKFVDFCLNSQPQKLGRDLAYYLNKK